MVEAINSRPYGLHSSDLHLRPPAAKEEKLTSEQGTAPLIAKKTNEVADRLKASDNNIKFGFPKEIIDVKTDSLQKTEGKELPTTYENFIKKNTLPTESVKAEEEISIRPPFKEGEEIHQNERFSFHIIKVEDKYITRRRDCETGEVTYFPDTDTARKGSSTDEIQLSKSDLDRFEKAHSESITLPKADIIS